MKLNGWITGYVLLLFCAAGAMRSPAQTFRVLANFDGTSGAQPVGISLVQGTNGNFYGTTQSGGPYGQGAVFKVTTGGKLTALHDFCSQTGCPDGRQSNSPLIQASDGSFYGTTTYGGINDDYGTIFRVTAQGVFTTLYRFCSQANCADGAYPYGGLIQATDGDFYGTTNEGGDPTCFAPYGCGTVFKITSHGKLTTLHRFHSTEGRESFAGLVQATNGDFYGTTGYGGANGYGTVFRVTLAGSLTTLYSFCSQASCSDGAQAYGTLIQATDGNLYGTTEGGGSLGFGTIFRISPSGVLATLQSFNLTDGSDPNDGLVEGTNGNFYGTTYAGGDTNSGTLFEITPKGTLTTLHSFCNQNCADGGYPNNLVQATDGKLYGTTQTGGANNDGLVFTLSVGLSPFVETQPASGKVKTEVIILGNNLTGATKVTFNGTVATFTVLSSTEIKTTVPSGATTGKVKVVTPSRTLTSNVDFRVT